MYLIRVHVGKVGMSVLLHLSTSNKNISLYGKVIIFFLASRCLSIVYVT